MLKKILLSLLISNIVISTCPPLPINPNSGDLPTFEMEDPFEFDDGEEFYFDQDNLVECCGCSNWAMFIFYDECDIYGLCAKCYLGG